MHLKFKPLTIVFAFLLSIVAAAGLGFTVGVEHEGAEASRPDVVLAEEHDEVLPVDCSYGERFDPKRNAFTLGLHCTRTGRVGFLTNRRALELLWRAVGLPS